MTAIVITMILVALVFDFINGFHDAANSIATVVSTRVLSPQLAVLWAAFFNFVAAFMFETRVASTIGKGVVDPGAITLAVVTAGLLGAIVWDLITWWLGLPTSSSHALIGGLMGAAVAHNGWAILQWGGIGKIALFIVLSPLIGMVLGFFNMVTVLRVVKRSAPARVDGVFRKLQLASAAAYSLGHGLNDAQKTMGIIMLILVSTGNMAEEQLSKHAPMWIIVACSGAIAAGTMFGGWRIVRTMGARLTKLQPIGGFAAEGAGAATIIGASWFGIPVSTTHTITGAIVGVGATRRLSAVRWGVAGSIVWAWVLTIPASAIIAALVFLPLDLLI
ncbi:MAG: inorganic phosphate transporter [Deltaproteobacteria bacterium]|nr:inorganic phosphate transporter [Deltaproteobacteria bacterium]